MTAEQIFDASDEGEPVMISHAQAVREIKAHSLDPAEFFAECGPFTGEIDGAAVLAWLGY